MTGKLLQIKHLAQRQSPSSQTPLMQGPFGRDLRPIYRRRLNCDCIAGHSRELILPKPSKRCFARFHAHESGHGSLAEGNTFVDGKFFVCFGKSHTDEEDVTWSEGDSLLCSYRFDEVEGDYCALESREGEVVLFGIGCDVD